jgi:hypothetical protein
MDVLTAHHNVSYLLAPQTSPMGGIGSPSTRLVLLGSQSPQVFPTFHKDPDAIIFSEIAEFAMSLTTIPKGQDTFNGVAHLQVYKFIRAASLAEMGHLQLASRYDAPTFEFLCISKVYLGIVRPLQLAWAVRRRILHAAFWNSWKA